MNELIVGKLFNAFPLRLY